MREGNKYGKGRSAERAYYKLILIEAWETGFCGGERKQPRKTAETPALTLTTTRSSVATSAMIVATVKGKAEGSERVKQNEEHPEAAEVVHL